MSKRLDLNDPRLEQYLKSLNKNDFEILLKQNPPKSEDDRKSILRKFGKE